MGYLNIERISDVVVVEIELPVVVDSLTSRAIWDELSQPESLVDASQLILDFGNVSLMTSEMLGGLVRFRRDMEKRGIRLLLCGLNENLSYLLDLTKLGPLFELYPTRANALERLDADEYLIRQEVFTEFGQSQIS